MGSNSKLHQTRRIVCEGVDELHTMPIFSGELQHRGVLREEAKSNFERKKRLFMFYFFQCDLSKQLLGRFSKNRQEEENTITFRLKCIVIA